MHRVDGAVHERHVLGVAGGHPVDDLARDLAGRQADAEVLAQVPGPLRRAHAHEPALRVRGPVPAPFGDQTPADLLPDRLGVHQDPVQVEHDGLDHV